jgi:hypothetical protein
VPSRQANHAWLRTGFIIYKAMPVPKLLFRVKKMVNISEIILYREF